MIRCTDLLKLIGMTALLLSFCHDAHGGILGTLRFFPNERSFGQFGTEAGEFRTPTGIALSPDGFLIVTDFKNNSVLRFDDDGRFAGQILPGPIPFDGPVAVAFDSKKNLYVVEEKSCRIRKFTTKGELLSTFGGPGTGNGQFRTPRGIVIGGTDEIFISDCDNHRIQVFDGNFGWLRNIHYKDNLRRPCGPRGLAIDRTGRLSACLSNIHRIVRFDAQGNVDLVVGEEGTGFGQFLDPRYLAFDLQNNFFVTDFNNGRIQRFNSRGEFQFSVGFKGSGKTQFKGPQGITIDLKGNVYIADSDNFRVQIMLINELLADLNFADYYFAQKQYDKALPLYQKIAAKVPLHKESVKRIISICETFAEKERDANRLDKAKPYLEEILRLQPSNTKALQFSRWILWRNNKGMVYYVTLGSGILLTFIFLVTTMVKILTSE